MGYAFDSPVWLVYNLTTRKVPRTRNATFNETWIPSPLFSSEEPVSLPTSPSSDAGEPLHFLTAFDGFEDALFVPPPIVVVPPLTTISARQHADEEALILHRAPNPRSRSERALAHSDVAMPPPSAALSVVELSSYKKAMTSPDKVHWLLATENGFSSLTSKGT